MTIQEELMEIADKIIEEDIELLKEMSENKD